MPPADDERRVTADTEEPASRNDADKALLRAKSKTETFAGEGSALQKRAAADGRALRTPEDARKEQARLRRQIEAARQPEAADEARLRLLEVGARLAELTGDPADREQLERDVAAYLARGDARQKDRARRVLEPR